MAKFIIQTKEMRSITTQFSIYLLNYRSVSTSLWRRPISARPNKAHLASLYRADIILYFLNKVKICTMTRNVLYYGSHRLNNANVHSYSLFKHVQLTEWGLRAGEGLRAPIGTQ